MQYTLLLWPHANARYQAETRRLALAELQLMLARVAPEAADEVLRFIAISGTNSEVLSALEGYLGRNEIFDQGYAELSTVVRYLSAFGVPEETAVRACTLLPARIASAGERIGSLAPGKWADLLVCGEDLSLRQVILGGKRIR